MMKNTIQKPERTVDEINQEIHRIESAIQVIENRITGRPITIKDSRCQILNNHHNIQIPCIKPSQECLNCALYRAHLTMEQHNNQEKGKKP